MIGLSAAPRALVILTAGSWGGAVAKLQDQEQKENLEPAERPIEVEITKRQS